MVWAIGLSMLSAVVSAQQQDPMQRISDPAVLKRFEMPTTVNTAVHKVSGHYTKEQWRRLIDSLWGPGLPGASKLVIFDNFWSIVDQKWGGFPHLNVNWDSLNSVFRPEVANNVSRGRFSAILSRLTRALNEIHVYTFDVGIDGTMGYYSLSDPEYPNYPSFHYTAGIPLININASYFRTCFGAGLTPLPDSTALVYNVMPNHPLGLQPGDIILGYDNIPWMKLVNDLFDAELPITESGKGLGSTAAASLHNAITSSGMNWGLFDMIDVKKYPTNEVVHYPTSMLGSIKSPYLIATEQLPVKGVPFPDLQNNKLVSWGVVAGTSIGYIYVLDWYGVPYGQTGELFTQAVDELMHKYHVQGLILDFRNNQGGTPNLANGGFRQLFNFDPLSNFSMATRTATADDHLAFTVNPFNSDLIGPFAPGTEIFDHPIAVLTGPLCLSAGDYNANRMRFHPMVRFFGLPTAGAYVAYAKVNGLAHGTWQSSFAYRIDYSSGYSSFAHEGFQIHNPFQVDEEVWLTRDGVAKGKDDVVERALAWITSLAYAHDAKPNKDTLRARSGSVTITAKVDNPGNHALVVSAVVVNAQGAQIDSLALMNDGLHGDGAPDDSVWGAFVNIPVDDGTYYISIRTDDKTAGTFRRLPIVASFTVVRTGVNDVADDRPKSFSLDQNYPNPFNPLTTIVYALPKSTNVRLTVFDVLGREVRTLVNERKQPGRYETTFNATNLASGVYLYRLQAGGFVDTKKLMLVR